MNQKPRKLMVVAAGLRARASSGARDSGLAVDGRCRPRDPENKECSGMDRGEAMLRYSLSTTTVGYLFLPVGTT